MFKKITLSALLLVLFTSLSFAGIKFGTGQTTLKESPSNNSDSELKSVTHYGLDFDIGIPFVGVDFLVSAKYGEAKQSNEELKITETSYGVKKTFLKLIKPYLGLGVSNGRVEFKTAFDGKDQQSYNTNWISTGVNVALAVVQFGVEYRYSQKTEIEFEYNGDKTKRDIASNSQSIYFGFGLGF